MTILLKAGSESVSLPTTMGFMSNAILHFSKLSDFAILEIPVHSQGAAGDPQKREKNHTWRYTNDKILGSKYMALKMCRVFPLKHQGPKIFFQQGASKTASNKTSAGPQVQEIGKS